MISENKINTLSLAVMSGKGGVGKSNLALNIGYSLAQRDHSLLLMDCDLGLANLDVLLGMTPEGNLQDVLQGKADINTIVLPIAPDDKSVTKDFHILPAASGVPELADMDKEARTALIASLEPTLKKYQMVFLDLGAGINETVQIFAAMASVRLVVLTPEPTSLTDAYALMKVLCTRLGVKDFLVIVNQVESKKEETATFQRLSTACERFLGFTPIFLGGVRSDNKMLDAVRHQKPLMKLYPNSPAAQDINAIADRLIKIYVAMKDRLKDQPPLKNPF